MADTEVEAKKMGWVPKEQFRGDEAKWVDDETFVERGKNMIPLLKENIERMSTKYGAVENELRELKKTTGEFIEFSKQSEERAYNRAKKQYEKEIVALKAQQKQAVAAGDTATYEHLEQKMESLEPPEKPEIKVETKTEKQTDTPVETPELKAWKADNPWFLTDKKMAKFAIAIEEDVASENPGKSQVELLKIITNEVKTRFPDKFKNPNREKGDSVDTGSSESRTKGSKKRGFDDLPKDAKDAFKKFEAMAKSAGKEFKKEDYLKNYEWDEEE